MSSRARRFGALSGALALALVLGSVASASAVDYPTWDEVEAARNNEAATAATVANINGLLDGLQAEAARLDRKSVV